MTRKSASDINYLSINENFPVAGEDNDTQVFRDNFDTIKTSLRLANEEITDIYNNSARTDEENDFTNNPIRNAVFDSCKEKVNGINVIDAAVVDTITIDYENGNYQIFKLESNAAFTFQNLPTDTTAVAKLTLEFFGDNRTRTITFVGSDGAQFMYSANFPTTGLSVKNLTDRLIVEIWRHSSNFIFVNYLGDYNLTPLDTPTIRLTTTAQRDSLSPKIGTIIYNTTTSQLEIVTGFTTVESVVTPVWTPV